MRIKDLKDAMPTQAELIRISINSLDDDEVLTRSELIDRIMSKCPSLNRDSIASNVTKARKEKYRGVSYFGNDVALQKVKEAREADERKRTD